MANQPGSPSDRSEGTPSGRRNSFIRRLLRTELDEITAGAGGGFLAALLGLKKEKAIDFKSMADEKCFSVLVDLMRFAKMTQEALALELLHKELYSRKQHYSENLRRLLFDGEGDITKLIDTFDTLKRSRDHEGIKRHPAVLVAVNYYKKVAAATLKGHFTVTYPQAAKIVAEKLVRGDDDLFGNKIPKGEKMLSQMTQTLREINQGAAIRPSLSIWRWGNPWLWMGGVLITLFIWSLAFIAGEAHKPNPPSTELERSLSETAKTVKEVSSEKAREILNTVNNSMKERKE